MKKEMIGIDCLGNPISHYDDVGAEIAFCQDMGQYLGGGACCYDFSCPHSGYCSILRDSVSGGR